MGKSLEILQVEGDWFWFQLTFAEENQKKRQGGYVFCAYKEWILALSPFLSIQYFPLFPNNTYIFHTCDKFSCWGLFLGIHNHLQN